MSLPGGWQFPGTANFDNMHAPEGDDNDGPNTAGNTNVPNDGEHGHDDHADQPVLPERMSIVISDSQGGSLTFMVKPNLKLKKAMDAYATRTSRDRATLRFLFDGERVQDDSTAASLAMEDGDIIEVHTEQFGGAPTTNNADGTGTVTTTTVQNIISTGTTISVSTWLTV